METPSPQLTLLRIKRKRTEEPLDALLLQTQVHEKRLRKDTNVLTVNAEALPTIFRLAETVEEKGLKIPAEAQRLKERISRRLMNRAPPETTEERKDRLVQEKMNTIRQARYRVVQKNRNSAMLPDMDLFQIYEAVREDEDKKTPQLFPDEDNADDEDILYNFIPMVKEYLTLNERKQEDENDYVYDVYYRDDSKSADAIQNGNVGSLVWFDEDKQYMNDKDSDSDVGNEEDEDSNAEDYYQNDYPDEESDGEFEDQFGYSSEDDEDYY
ncbi:hypothetical protein BX666DRAFT_1930068 [Dichotomocladium elegans]|nr:hypothetical protein BX666DRAFT_1930068 [Dichotomocladium elegans]